MKFVISSTTKGVDWKLGGALIKDEVVDLDANDVVGAIDSYNKANPGRTAISSGALRPVFPCDTSDGTFIAYGPDTNLNRQRNWPDSNLFGAAS